MLKIVTDRSDNGNEFLCLRCISGNVRSGRQMEKEVFCGNGDFSPRGYASSVLFPVTHCTGYIPRTIEPGNVLRRVLEKQAWYVVASTEGRGVTLIPPDEAVRRQMVRE